MKKAVEAYWAGKISADDLVKAAADVRKTSWTSLKERGVDLIPRYEGVICKFIIRAYADAQIAAISPSTTTFSTTQPPSTSSPSATLATTSLLSMSTSPWDVDVRLRVSTFRPVR